MQPDLVFWGNHQAAKKTAATLIRVVGINPVDLGELSAARYIEPFSLLVAQLAYNSSDGNAFALRFERFPNHARSLRRFLASARMGSRTADVSTLEGGPIRKDS